MDPQTECLSTMSTDEIIARMGSATDRDLGLPEGTQERAAEHLRQTITDDEYDAMDDSAWFAAVEQAFTTVEQEG